ncbi:MAG TPA: hypothetical protein VF485_18515 [Sphingomonas sp.]
MIVSKPLPGSATMRWIPTITVLVAPVAWAIGVSSRAVENGIGHWIVGSIPTLCLIVVATLSLLQPRPINGQLGVPLDEREIQLRARATLRGMAVVAITGPLICFYMSMAIQFAWWTPSREDWGHLLHVLVCWIIGMPMAFANWQIGRPLKDEDDQ